MNDPAANTVVDLSQYPTAAALVARCQEFFAEVQDLTPGHALQETLNRTYGPGTPYFEDFSAYIKRGLLEGWVATTELDGARYRRGKIALPSAESRYFSITTVYMSSSELPLSKEAETEETKQEAKEQDEYLGQYHSHPYGEINCVIPLSPTAQLKGMSIADANDSAKDNDNHAWQSAGWTSPGPGTHHHPQVRGGALVALFFLPAGRISYTAKPGDAQPACV